MRTTIKHIAAFLLLNLLLLPSSALAASCTDPEAETCTFEKSDLHFQTINALFAPLDWTYGEEHGAEYWGKKHIYLFKGAWHTLGYTIPGEQTVNYYVYVADFSSRKKAAGFYKKLMRDSTKKKYTNPYGTVYRVNTNPGNGRSLAWVHNDLMIEVFAPADAPQRDAFLEQSFAIYAATFPPTK
jgi:hypothetical protein